MNEVLLHRQSLPVDNHRNSRLHSAKLLELSGAAGVLESSLPCMVSHETKPATEEPLSAPSGAESAARCNLLEVMKQEKVTFAFGQFHLRG